MQALADTWSKLSLQRKGMLIGGIIATIFVFFLLARVATQPRMALLFGGLEDKAAGEIIAALDQMGVPTEVRGNAIYVPASEQDRLRLKLAGEGLMKGGAVGYELLDNLTGFGTTDAMFKTAVRRATEGELQRTIESMPDVQAAKVMLAMGERRPFSRDQIKTTASVQVRSAGGRLKESSAMAIRYLVSLAVPGLEPDQVAVIDSKHGVILKPGDERVSEAGEEREERISARLRQKLEQLLAANVGEDNFRVEVTVETTRETVSKKEVLVDPESQVPVSSSSNETTEQSTTPSAAVTVASNLPDGDAGGGEGGKTDRTTSSETLTFRYSETVRDELVEPGAIKRIGIGIVLDHREEAGPDGTVTRTPRSREELATIEQLVKSAVAFDEERGDTVRVESLPFVASTADALELEEPSAFGDFLSQNGAMLLQLLILGVVALLLGLFVVKPILTTQPEYDEYAIDGALVPAHAAPVPGEPLAEEGALGTVAPEQQLAALPAGSAESAVPALAAVAAATTEALPAALAGGAVGEVLNQSQANRLREVAQEKADETVATLKAWLADADADASAGGA